MGSQISDVMYKTDVMYSVLLF